MRYRPDARVLHVIAPPDEDALRDDVLRAYDRGLDLKYASAHKVEQELDQSGAMFAMVDAVGWVANKVLPRMDNLVIDVRPQVLCAGETPGHGYWHTDCTLDMERDEHEHHILWQTGFCGSNTEFVLSELNLKPRKRTGRHGGYILAPEFDKVVRQAVSAGAHTAHTWDNSVMSYSRPQIHRASPAVRDGWRLLVRFTATNIIRGRGRR